MSNKTLLIHYMIVYRLSKSQKSTWEPALRWLEREL